MVNGIYSNGDEVFVCVGNKLYRYTSSTEKWDSYPIINYITQTAQLAPGAASFKFIDGNFCEGI
jgi:hypothetical protein